MNGKNTPSSAFKEEQNPLTIGGGPDVFVVYAATTMRRSTRRLDPGQGGGSADLNVGRQRSNTAELLVGKDGSEGGEVFAEKGELDPNVSWRSTEDVPPSRT
jgi:hypothetical protein